MSDGQTREPKNKPADDPGRQVVAPAISLPKGGGAIRGIGEKFAANPVTGTGSMTVPIATSPGRSGFGPQLSLSYDSGAGNGIFGLGWNLPLPSITRKTEKGLPEYRDAEESDVFILSGAEDLVPVLRPGGSRFRDDTTFPGYVVHRYRPRIEGLLARIERWTRQSDGDVHWRATSRDNILTIYGKDADSRIADPEAPGRIFSWLICESRDDRGNAVLYGYKPEDGFGVDADRDHERNRGDRNDPRRTANRYIKHIRYGNRNSLLDSAAKRPRFLTEAQVNNAGWMFEVVFDYGEHDADVPGPNNQGRWHFRCDPFSTYRPGFEVRTTRLCQRVLMFHHFPGELGVGSDCLVRSTDFTYSHEEEPASARNPIYTFLRAVTQSGYKRQGDGYRKRDMPPVEFEYARPTVQDTVQKVDAESLENLPMGADGSTCQWTDLHGEGIPGILTEQADTWYYKRNISPIHEDRIEFAPLERVGLKPNLSLAGGTRFLDLAGDGLPDLVVMDGPVTGLYEHDGDEGWHPFRSFTARLNRDMRDPNVKFVDLDGDGQADVMITEDNAFVWHASLAEAGFGPARRVAQVLDEDKGPRLVFADRTQSVYLADFSGDGLTDLGRIRNGEACYWPNLGYCRFGAKVTMDNAPWFDNPDQLIHKRIRLADIDGTGTTDIIYLHRDGVRLYFNQSGNSWSRPHLLAASPPVNDRVNIVPTDLHGNGTTCLVWSSPLPSDSKHPMRFVDLMGGKKPHLLYKTKNNLGAETLVHYAPSTKFYLRDKRAGKPWITRLPFPVHCVEKVTIRDKWRGTSFSTTYSYHHGYFDGIEREFRGFGRVEQVDIEDFGEFARGNANSPYITNDLTLYQPPVKTVTWYHTGACLDGRRILTQFEQEYFPHWFENLRPGEANVLGNFQENILPEPDLEIEALTNEERHEALRACKGMMLRQEVYELDVDTLEQNRHQPVKLFTTAYHNCHIRRLQPRANNRHAVFLAAESETITYHYELDLRQDTVCPDPRVAHTLNLSYDGYANLLQSVAVVYPRIGQFEDDSLEQADLALIRQVQGETHLVYTENRYTDDFGDRAQDAALTVDNYRLRVPCEVLTYELTGITPEDAGDIASLDPRDNRYFTLDELRSYRLSQVHQSTGESVAEISYHRLPTGTNPQKRLVEHVRTLFFKDEPTDAQALRAPLPLGRLGRLGLPYETYKLALTEDLLTAIFEAKLTADIRTRLSDAELSGYLAGDRLVAHFAPPISAAELAGQHWIPSGITGFAPDAAQHFYLPERYTDPFGNVTALEYDPRHLFVTSSTDAMDNTTRITQFDFRVLAPRQMMDINDNLSEVTFDVLGQPTAMALKGNGNQGDNLTGFTDTLTNPEPPALAAFFETPELNEAQARTWLGNATIRHIYTFGEVIENGKRVWARHPACVCGIMREQHAASGGQSPLQASFEYSDGTGTVVVMKIQAEPEIQGAPMRWVANGKTIHNNKGRPVKQFEPYFSPAAAGHLFEEPQEQGVTPVIYYDAVGRTVRTEMPDRSYSRVEFSPWHICTFDQNDTVLEEGNAWFANKTAAAATALEKHTAQLTADHADTPTLALLDSLGREVVSIAHNRVRSSAGELTEEKYLTFTKLDPEGKALWIRDARKNLVMQYIQSPVPNSQPADPLTNYTPAYDIGGNLLFQHAMDAGARWTLNDAAGKPMFAWDSRGHIFRTDYDKLQRPVGSFVKGTDLNDLDRVIQFEKIVYGDTPGNGLPDAKALNLRGQPYQHKDSAGVITHLGHNSATNKDEAFDFKGNLLRTTRQMAADYKGTPDWSQNPALEEEVFNSSTKYDALNRPVMQTPPHTPAMKPSIIRIGYNEANLLEKMDANLRKEQEPDGELKWIPFVTNIDYNAKGQRERIDYENGASTAYEYDRDTFRLKRLQTVRGQKGNHDCTPAMQPRTCEDPPLRCSRLSSFACVVQDLNYTYDPVGNITRVQDDAQQIIYFRNKRVEPGNDYTYDAVYRLIRATGREHLGQTRGQSNSPTSPDAFNRFHTRLAHPGDGNAMGRYIEQYVYDAVGNILSMKHSGTDPVSAGWQKCYQYAIDSNRLLSTSNPRDPHNPGDPCPTQYAATPVYSEKYDYDPHGNMAGMPHLPLMQWNFKDRLQATSRQVVNPTPPPDKVPEITYYIYDTSGRRVRKVTQRQNDARKKERIYFGGVEIERRFNGNGSGIVLEREILHIIDGNRRIAMVETCTQGNEPGVPPQLIRYQFSNHLGSAGIELDRQAKIISYEEYSPYGCTSYQAVHSAMETPKRHRYTGKERDEENGLYYNFARYYAPWLGIWTSCDPRQLVDGVNVYRYAHNAPNVVADPNGTQPPDPRLFNTFENFAAATPGPYSNDYLLQIWSEAQMPSISPAEASAIVDNLEFRATPVGQGLRETIVRIDIDEPIPVSKGGGWDAPGNKQFYERLGNQLTKNAGIDTSPKPGKPPISLAKAAAEGPEAFKKAANEMMTRRFSEVEELNKITQDARSAMKNLNRPRRVLANAINKSIRGRIAKGATAETQLVQCALREVGIDPGTLSQKAFTQASPPATRPIGAARSTPVRINAGLGRGASARSSSFSGAAAEAALEFGFYGVMIPMAAEVMMYYGIKLDEKIGASRWLYYNWFLPNLKKGAKAPRSDIEVMERVIGAPTTWSLGFY